MSSQLDDDVFAAQWAEVVASYREAAADIPDQVLNDIIFSSRTAADASKDAPSPVRTVDFTGKVKQGAYYVRIDGVEVALTQAEFVVFSQICIRCLEVGEDAHGYTNLAEVAGSKANAQKIVSRLRRKLDKYLERPGVGLLLVVNASDTRYYLDMPCSGIAIHRRPLETLALTSPAQIQRLLNRLWHLAEAVDD